MTALLPIKHFSIPQDALAHYNGIYYITSKVDFYNAFKIAEPSIENHFGTAFLEVFNHSTYAYVTEDYAFLAKQHQAGSPNALMHILQDNLQFELFWLWLVKDNACYTSMIHMSCPEHGDKLPSTLSRELVQVCVNIDNIARRLFTKLLDDHKTFEQKDLDSYFTKLIMGG
ncbi:hypothetical protein KK083_20485 [Fulvivirgaceae bacterium PWU4]|uniref:Uncharacterized protein n=1 Tax=Chryseosolibacter histidini TaxID=2782349 RepID=A0AAP2DQB9_9BACT|nr:hypothetical protein [Chryseosolibacter histidini]MBT1699287.1 hypothetical protein [Chryseosolibacter histidini]